MKKNLLMLTVLCFIGNLAFSQLSLTPINPPTGFKFDLVSIPGSAAMQKPSKGANQVWSYTLSNLQASFPYEVVDVSTIPSNYLSAAPGTDYVVRMKMAPSPNEDPMDFYDNTGSAMIRIAQKGSGTATPDPRTDTMIKVGMKLNEGIRNSSTERIYYGWGQLSINNVQFDSVAVIKQHYIGMDDTAYYFYQTKPHFHYIGLLVYSKAAMKIMQYYQPTVASGLYFSKNEYKVFPNPASDFIEISTNKVKTINYKIYNINAQIIESGVLELSESRLIDLKMLETGLYLLELESLNGIEHHKIMKQ